ncbi:hypothetical protein C499_08697 [Halogeometricum borinquense DSM 11551]|uniref:Uncharacterized protein n=2 Tax=Halogeometricum borinquense TaxID=60847 RepID=E4NME9_HALBP|nr:hypothetical protein [Halogeometricum borinquense]ADQ68447.1 hypothetical protein Hbor_29080 [Halogeometricum borinquense DSM 11551]ELY27909.1 hypothetical protein C499_08697 [Halogeometricum borinquense DSM 11551]RYJ15020.1 hypothetical protein ELS19_14385 [Halogeometricum borinquense]
MALMPWLNLFLQILWDKVMPIVGVISVLSIFLIMGGHNIPVGSVRDKLGRRLIGRGSRIMGKTLMAIKDEDGLWSLKPATYDGENNGYWVPTADGREFYDASGVGGDPGGWYGGTALAIAYDGLGALAEPASGEVGRQARIKMQHYAEDLSTIDYATWKAQEDGPELIAAAGTQIADSLVNGTQVLADEGRRARDKLGESVGSARDRLGDGVDAARDRVGDDEDDPLTDGGKTVIDEWETMLPTRKVVDLRDTIHAAPFNVKPQQFHRVAENAKKGQQGFASLGPLGQAGLLMGAFMLGAIVAYIGFTAAGSGGGISIPMGGAGMIMPPSGVLP